MHQPFSLIEIELTDLIISTACQDGTPYDPVTRSNKLNIALVCRTFREIALKYLFESIRLYFDRTHPVQKNRRAFILTQLIRENRLIPGYIRRIQISEYYFEGSWILDPHIVYVLQEIFHKGELVQLDLIDSYMDRRGFESVWKPYIAPSLRKLTIRVEQTSGNLPVEFLDVCTKLHSLSLEDPLIEDENRMLYANFHQRPKIKELRLDIIDITSDDLEMLAKLVDLTGVIHLDYRDIGLEHGTVAMQSLLRICSSLLKSLSVFYDPKDYSSINLTDMRSLSNLKLYSVCSWYDSPDNMPTSNFLNQICSVLSTIPSQNNIQHFALVFHLIYNCRTTRMAEVPSIIKARFAAGNWDHLDDILFKISAGRPLCVELGIIYNSIPPIWGMQEIAMLRRGLVDWARDEWLPRSRASPGLDIVMYRDED